MNKTFVNPNDLAGHLKMIRKIAWNMHLETNHDPEDLFSEGCLHYLLLQSSYDPDRGAKVTSMLWTAIRNRLRNYLRNTEKIKAKETIDLLEFAHEAPIGYTHRKLQINDNFHYQCF